MKKQKTIKIGLAFGLLLTALFAYGNEKNFAQTIAHEGVIELDPRQTAYQSLLIAPYKQADVFISEEKKSDEEFTTVGGYWAQDTPAGTNIEAEIRFEIEGKWSQWLSLDEEIESESGDRQMKFTTASTNPASAMQYKFIMYGDGISTPRVYDTSWTFIRTVKELELEATPSPMYSSSQLVSDVAYLALTSTSSKVISRRSWGANEKYRYYTGDEEEPQLVKLEDDFYNKYKKELELRRVVKEDSKGKKYTWPLQYPKKVQKIIIHHTATTNNLKNPEQAVRDIYYYHAISRGWGDIGYNYIVDTKGKVYEGRYGGEGVIGAHAGPGNNGSIGIAVLGDYEKNKVPKKVISALGQLVGEKAKIHKIDVNGKSKFRGERTPNIFGHKDIMATSCPGVHLYEKLRTIRSLAEKVTKKKVKSNKDYDFEDLSDIYYLELDPGQTETISFKLKNIGKETWDSKTFIVVNKDAAFDGVVSFPGTTKMVSAKMNQKSVRSGKTATFDLKVKGGVNGGEVMLNVAPVINGGKKISDYIKIPVTVYQSNYKYEFISKKFSDEALKPGEEFTGWVKLKNTGNTTWKKTGPNSVVLAADHEKGRKSTFVSPARSEMATLEESEVKPGDIGKFIFKLKVPNTSGFQKEYFSPLVNGKTWMTDSGMYFDVMVSNGKKYTSKVTGVSSRTVLEKGKTYNMWVNIQNMGEKTWTDKNFKLEFSKDSNLKITSAKLLNNSLKPGETGRISFKVVASGKTKGTLTLMPKVDGRFVLSKQIKFDFEIEDVESKIVKTVKTVNTDEPDIRIKLSYEGNPRITANGDFKVYSGNKLIKSLDKNDTVEIKKSGSKYSVKIGSKKYTKTDPIRFVPRSSKTIIEIENYDNAPGWNPKLNDNTYRGTLEVRIDSGKLIVINELPLEDYLKGLGEVSNSEETEKIKSIMVAARSYALYYITKDEKFPGKPYHLDDDPNVSQRYLGYGVESRAPNVRRAVERTEGKVVTYNGELVKTPYFSQSDGVATKSANAVWKWDAPYLVSVPDAHCNSDTFYGHGVGLSGCGATGMAQNGYDYLEILKHYYTGVKITEIY